VGGGGVGRVISRGAEEKLFWWDYKSTFLKDKLLFG
jgi:hypothetical protein